MKLVLVAAIGANGVIGADGDIPWHYPTDLAHFKRTTTGHPVLMGRRTFETIHDQLGEPLPERRNIVLTSRPESLPATVVAVDSTAAAIREVSTSDATTAYVIGGRTVYEQFLPLADELLLTEINESYAGDTYFPTVSWDEWAERNRDTHEGFDIVRYVRTGSAQRPPRD